MNKHRLLVIVLTLVFAGTLLGTASCATTGANQPTASPTSTATPTLTPTAPPTSTPSPTPTETPTPVPTARPTPPPTPTPKPAPAAPPAPIAHGQVILVSLSRQWLYAYDDGKLVFANAVETGQPALPTPSGTFSVLSKTTDTWFTSPWPPGSPYYYNPTHINYAMLFKQGGFYLHDAWWHVKFGPGGNVPHQLPDGTWETGSHGCVGMTIANAARLYAWVHIGTPVVVR